MSGFYTCKGYIRFFNGGSESSAKTKREKFQNGEPKGNGITPKTNNLTEKHMTIKNFTPCLSLKYDEFLLLKRLEESGNTWV